VNIALELDILEGALHRNFVGVSHKPRALNIIRVENKNLIM